MIGEPLLRGWAVEDQRNVSVRRSVREVEVLVNDKFKVGVFGDPVAP
jgi:hypothetical protein